MKRIGRERLVKEFSKILIESVLIAIIVLLVAYPIKHELMIKYALVVCLALILLLLAEKLIMDMEIPTFYIFLLAVVYGVLGYLSYGVLGVFLLLMFISIHAFFRLLKERKRKKILSEFLRMLRETGSIYLKDIAYALARTPKEDRAVKNAFRAGQRARNKKPALVAKNIINLNQKISRGPSPQRAPSAF